MFPRQGIDFDFFSHDLLLNKVNIFFMKTMFIKFKENIVCNITEGLEIKENKKSL